MSTAWTIPTRSLSLTAEPDGTSEPIPSTPSSEALAGKSGRTNMAAAKTTDPPSHPTRASRPKEVSEQIGTDDGREPCPPPLAWRQVLETFRIESDRWELDRGKYLLKGRTWGTGPPLYFLCGWNGTHELFALSVWLLRRDFRCVLYDYPSCERNSTRPPNLTIDDFTADLFAIADLHHDSHVNVYATSFGSAVALSAMLERPHRLRRAVIQAGFAQQRLTVFERQLTNVCRRLPGSLRQIPWRDRIQQQNHMQWFPPFDLTRWQFFLENTGQVPIASLATRAATVKKLDFRTQLHQIQQAVQIIHCEGDGRIIAKCQQELENGLPNATIESLHTCGQLPYLTHPHRLTNVIRPFLLREEPMVAETDHES